MLAEVGLPRNALGWSLASFNIGVELGQLVLVIPCAWLLLRLHGNHASVAKPLAMAGSIVVSMAGTWWFLQRIGN
mgnify:CR=1 FL=1